MRFVVFFVALFVAGIAHAQHSQMDIAYGLNLPFQVLDLYSPAKRPAPLVIFVHGGDWSGGGRRGVGLIARALNSEGFAVAGIDYRLLPAASIQDEASDVALAAAFLLSHAEQFGIDPRRFALAGHSSGGHLVALVATDPSYARHAGLDLSRLAVVIPLDGVFDLSLPSEMRSMKNKVGYDVRAWRNLSPINHVKESGEAGHAAFCLLHEDREPRFIAQSDSFAAVLRAHGLAVEEDVLPGLTHVELTARFDDRSTPTARLVTDCLKRFLGS